MWVLPATSYAQAILSPGPLAAAHHSLEGLENCLKCHEGGKQVAKQRCLSCHSTVSRSIDTHTGLHGHLTAAQQACQSCHHEHLGEDNALMPWKADRSDFKHAQTGFALRGAHATTGCDACHTKRLITDPTVLQQIASHPERRTYAGLPIHCAGCHFDEHRAQESGACSTCHTEKSWKQTTFNHSKSAYPLTGKHSQLACATCHLRLQDTLTPDHVFPAPVSRSYEQFVGIPHGTCSDCHRDPHEGKFGSRCTTCHTTAGWKVMIRTAEDNGFHENTHFALRGAHTSVTCRACHGPHGGHPAAFHGLPYAQCGDCHADAHESQLAGDCRDCHTVEGFLPTTYTVREHQHSKFPLVGAHQAVACNECHLADPSLDSRIPAAQRAKLRDDDRPELFSMARFTANGDLGTCTTCHVSPHGNQFAERLTANGCQGCHRETSWSDLTFDHNANSRFKLTGAHSKVACNGCHRAVSKDRPKEIVYKPLDTACASCHADVHMGQFLREGATACDTCHTTQDFKSTLFKHNAPSFTAFALTGAHSTLACAACHPQVHIETPPATVQRFKPLPQDCRSCHLDFHQGALADLLNAMGDAHGGNAPCSGCHTTTSWLPGEFAPHEETAFPLRGAHRAAACAACHTRGFHASLPQGCMGCHQDVHAGEFGAQCASCHSQDDWRVEFSIEAHRNTLFPLRGAHGVLPCQECHQGAFANNFKGTPVSCFGCHVNDYMRAATVSVDHVASGFSESCRDCHDPWDFTHARLDEHAACFAISQGPHVAIPCLTCHTSLRGSVATGSCTTNTAACTQCHVHNAAATNAFHTNVAGYQYADRKCYECHRFTAGP